MGHDESPTPKQNVILLQFEENPHIEDFPAIPGRSGAVLYNSGGTLCYQGTGGTHTILAAS